MKYDFVAFGDIVVDCFIKLKEARVECEVNDQNCLLCVKFGQKIPFESATEIAAVGNGPNAAVSAAKIGLKSAVATELGDDDNGKKCLEAMKAANVSTEFIGAHKGIPTNYHYVLQYETERTILIKHQLFPRALPKFDEPPQWFYLTSLAEGTFDFQHAIAAYAKEHNVKLAFQPGTFQIRAGVDQLKDVYAAAEVFFCNKEEAQQLLNSKEDDVKKLMETVRAFGPKIVVITDGPKGAYVLDDTGAYHAPMYPDATPPINRTGAGDATASGMTSFLALGMAPKDALLRGMINSAGVVRKLGAQAGLLSRDEIEEWYAKRPPEFEAKQI